MHERPQRYARPERNARKGAPADADAAIGALLADEPQGWPADAVHDRLIGDWHLWQRRRGHRTSTDDLLTAWFAVEASGARRPARYLDIGCGIGSVLLMTAHRLRPAECVGVEAQAQSALMAQRSVEALPADAPPIRVVHGDLRDATPAQLGSFDLITGSPPYLPLGTAIPSADPQRRACRMELRGGVEAYCATAARLLTPDGVFALVFQTVWAPRVLAAGAAAGLALLDRADITMRTDRAEPFLSVFAFVPASAAPGTEPPTRHFAVRDDQGELTPEYRQVRVALGVEAG